MIDLTIIIPVYNEIKTIEKLLNRVFKINIKKQIIVIDDASIDGTSKILKKYKKKIDKLITHKINKGKGAAIKNAQKYIRGRYTAIQDADLEYKPADLLKILNYIKKKKIKRCLWIKSFKQK